MPTTEARLRIAARELVEMAVREQESKPQEIDTASDARTSSWTSPATSLQRSRHSTPADSCRSTRYGSRTRGPSTAAPVSTPV